MPEYLMFKSRVNRIYNYLSTDLSEYLPNFTPDEEALEKDINRLLSGHGKKLDAVVVSHGDVVTLDCKSDNPKFNKSNIIVSVGKGLFSKEFECKIIGIEKGKDFTITVDGVDVDIKISSIKHTVLPVLCDEEVKSWNMENVNSVSDLRRYCIDKQLDRFLDDCESADMAAAYISQLVSQNSEFELCDEEVEMVVASMKKRMSELPQEQTNPEIEEMMKSICIDSFKISVIGNFICKKENKLLTLEDYEKIIKDFMMYNENKTEEQQKSDYTLFDFMSSHYGDTYSRAIDVYVKDFIKRKLNP